MSDDSSHLTWYDDLPVREIQENIAKLDDDPRASRLSLEQRVTLVYESAIARVLLEQCERYDDLRSDIEFDGESFELLRTLALERARVIAELFLSARREDVGIADHSFQGEGLLGAILALGVLKSCFVALTGDDPDRRLLLSADELDALVLNPLMDAWWEHALPRDEIAPPQFGSGAPPPAPPPTDAADARAPSRRCARDHGAAAGKLQAQHRLRAAGCGAESRRRRRRPHDHRRQLRRAGRSRGRFLTLRDDRRRTRRRAVEPRPSEPSNIRLPHRPEPVI